MTHHETLEEIADSKLELPSFSQDYEVKLVVCGKLGTGKSILLKAASAQKIKALGDTVESR